MKKKVVRDTLINTYVLMYPTLIPMFGSFVEERQKLKDTTPYILF